MRQVTSAYWFCLPKEAADMVRRMMGKRPLPDDEVTRRKVNEKQTAAMLATVSAETWPRSGPAMNRLSLRWPARRLL